MKSKNKKKDKSNKISENALKKISGGSLFHNKNYESIIKGWYETSQQGKTNELTEKVDGYASKLKTETMYYE